MQKISNSPQSVEIGTICAPYVMHKSNTINTKLRNELANFLKKEEANFKDLGIESQEVLYFGIHSFRESGFIFEPKKLPEVINKLLDAIRPICPPDICVHINSCLIIRHSSSHVLHLHRDDEPVIDLESFILTVSFGAKRTVTFVSNDERQRKEISLDDGSLLITSRYSQDFWQHGYFYEESPGSKKTCFSFKFRNIAPYFMLSY